MGSKLMPLFGVNFKKAIKFYQLRNEPLARIVFILVVAFNVLMSLTQKETTTDPELVLKLENLKTLAWNSAISLTIGVVIHLVTSAYVLSYLRELKGEDTSISAVLKKISKVWWKLTLGYVLYEVAVWSGLIFFVVPGIIIAITYIFYSYLLLDHEIKLSQAFRGSVRITDGYKKELFGIGCILGVILIFPLQVLLTIFIIPGNLVASSFVTSFLNAIIVLIVLRFITNVYIQLFYRSHDTNHTNPYH